MKEDKFKTESKDKKAEDTTKYGEFIPTFFTWNTLSEQKKKVKVLEKITKK